MVSYRYYRSADVCSRGKSYYMAKNRTILVTGGAGYIGSHISVALLFSNFDVVVLDNLSNSSKQSIERVAGIASGDIRFIHGDVYDRKQLSKIFSELDVFAVIHCAGLKSINESVDNPLDYYANNVAGSISLFNEMASAGVFRLVFSSSATVYGNPDSLPISEEQASDRASTPYGKSKRMVEQVLVDLATSDDRWKISILRYFNPVGAHESGLIGEDPRGVPNNLVPYIASVAAGKATTLKVYGNDYPTADGTGVRDYIHVMDLAEGHILALESLKLRKGLNIWNLGTGVGFSVLEVVSMFEKVNRCKVPFEIVERRLGDIASCYADCSKAEREIGWKPKRDLQLMLIDTWRWQTSNPEGYNA